MVHTATGREIGETTQQDWPSDRQAPLLTITQDLGFLEKVLKT